MHSPMKRPLYISINVDEIHDKFERALSTIKDGLNTNLGGQFATLQPERRNVWSMMIDQSAWWLEFELLSHRSFIVRSLLEPTHSGECLLKNNTSVTAMVSDVRAAFRGLKNKMQPVPAKRVK